MTIVVMAGLSAAGEFGEQRLAKIWTPLAAVFGKEEHQVAEGSDADPLDLLTPAFFGGDEASLRQHGEVGRKGALGQPALLDELTRRQSFRLMPHQKAEGREPHRMSERGQHREGGVGFHTSDLTDTIDDRQYASYFPDAYTSFG